MKRIRLALAILIVMALVTPAFAFWGDARTMAVQRPLISARVPTTGGSAGATQLTAQHATISSITVISESTQGYLIGVYNSNNTGNAGMAKGGSGDVLTGIITGLSAQGYHPQDAAILGVYLHGLAGDIAAKKFTERGVLASELIDALPAALRRLGARL